MDAMWDFLCNNSPKLICKPRAKTPCLPSENNPGKQVQLTPSNSKILQTSNRSTPKLNIEKSLNHISSKTKQTHTILTVRSVVKSPSAPKIQSSKKIMPLTPAKKFSPVLSSVNSQKTVTIVKKKIR